MDINKKIDMAINICNNGKYKKERFMSIYPFTTENINGYLDLFDLKDKKLLTVGSSSDQVFNAVLKDCYDITLFDICAFTEEYFYLKYAAIKLMTRDEFLNFFCYKNKLFTNNKKSFRESIFYELLDYLNNIKPEVSFFWEELLKRYRGIQIRKNLFNKDEYEVNMLKIMNRYLEDDNAYKLLRDKLDNIDIKFIYDNILNISDEIKYDNIFLSNIACYYKIDDIIYLFNRVLNSLNDDGKMLLSYLYDTDINSEYISGEDEIYNLPLVFNNLPKDIKFYTFIGNSGLRMHDKRMKDSVITYRKVRKI